MWKNEVKNYFSDTVIKYNFVMTKWLKANGIFRLKALHRAVDKLSAGVNCFSLPEVNDFFSWKSVLRCIQTKGEETFLIHIARETCRGLGGSDANKYFNAVLESLRMGPDCVSASGLPDKHQGDGQDGRTSQFCRTSAGLAQHMSGLSHLGSASSLKT